MYWAGAHSSDMWLLWSILRCSNMNLQQECSKTVLVEYFSCLKKNKQTKWVGKQNDTKPNPRGQLGACILDIMCNVRKWLLHSYITFNHLNCVCGSCGCPCHCEASAILLFTEASKTKFSSDSAKHKNKFTEIFLHQTRNNDKKNLKKQQKRNWTLQ